MIVSLNEIEATVLKAARGAGYAWGLAEEAGASARWLAAHGLPWLGTIGPLLEPAIVAQAVGPVPQANPLAAAAFLADRSSKLEDSDPPTPPIPAPLWIVGVLAMHWTEKNERLCIRWPGGEIVIADRRLLAATGNVAQLSPVAIQLVVNPATPVAPAVRFSPPSTTVDPVRWAALLALEKRTYVAATDQSRIAGAGAGLSDND